MGSYHPHRDDLIKEIVLLHMMIKALNTMENKKTEFETMQVIETGKVKGYYIILKGSPMIHYVFVYVNPGMGTSAIYGTFDLCLIYDCLSL